MILENNPLVLLIPGSALLIPGVSGRDGGHSGIRQQLTSWLATQVCGTDPEGRVRRVALVAAPAVRARQSVPTASGKENSSPHQVGAASPQSDQCTWNDRVTNLSLNLAGTGVPAQWWPAVALSQGQLQAAQPGQATAFVGLAGRCAGCAVLHSVGLYLLWQAGYRGHLEVIPADQLEQVLAACEYDVLLGVGDQAVNQPQAQVHRDLLHSWWHVALKNYEFEVSNALPLAQAGLEVTYQATSWRTAQNELNHD